MADAKCVSFPRNGLVELVRCGNGLGRKLASAISATSKCGGHLRGGWSIERLGEGKIRDNAMGVTPSMADHDTHGGFLLHSRYPACGTPKNNHRPGYEA